MRVIAPLSVSGLAVGQNITWSLGDIGQPIMVTQLQGKPVLQVFNESGTGFTGFLAASNKSFSLPAGGWANLEIDYGDTSILLTVVYVLQNWPVSILMATLFVPGETVSDPPSLGNSPIGIAGTVTTTGVQTLSNEGGAAGLLVIDIGPSGNIQSTEFFTDHFIINVIQSGVKHQALIGNTSGNPLQLGQAGDKSEVLGTLVVDQGV